MVLAALGAPESKIREQPSGDVNGGRYEEWIYGHIPQTVRFIRFVGDRVTVVEVAALGKPVEVHDKDEMAGYAAPVPTREIALGDRKPNSSESSPAPPPTLRTAGEAVEAVNQTNRVQFPADKQTAGSTPPATTASPKLL